MISTRPIRQFCFFVFVAFSLTLMSGCTSQPTSPSAVAQSPVVHVYRTTDGRKLGAHVFAPVRSDGAKTLAIVLFHGGGWSAGGPDWVYVSARRFAQMGLLAVAVEFRLADDKVTPIDALADTCASLAWLRTNATRFAIDDKRVAAYGVSAGGHLVSAAATLGCGNTDGAFGNGGPDAMLLWSPAVDVAQSTWFQKLLQGRAKAVDFSPVDHVPQRLAPTSIVQGAKDTVTRTEGARRFCEIAVRSGNRCELNVYANVGHLLTRNLADQEDNYDPDPVARADGIARHAQFLRSLWPDLLRSQ